MYYKEVKSHQIIHNVINEEELLERVDQDYELLEELFLVFVEDLPIQIREIEEAMNSHDCDQLKISAHRLKGALGNLAAREAYDIAAKMEMHAGQGEFAAAQYIYHDLVKQTNLVINALEFLVKNNSF